MPLAAIARFRHVPGALGLFIIAGLALITLAFLPPLPEPQQFQGFADRRAFFGVPNFLNVASNLPFLFVGIAGMLFVVRHAQNRRKFAIPQERWPYLVCFLAIALTCFGSSYFHLEIDPAGLFWDRLPMAIGFMSLLAAVIAERVSVKLGLRLLVPLVLIGAGSVIYWRWSALYATEDLLPYALVQYGSIAAVLFFCAVYRSRYTHGAYVVHLIAIYAIAKVCEVLDHRIYALGEIVSGHTLKHLIAAVATYWILRMLTLRTFIPGVRSHARRHSARLTGTVA